MRIAFREFVEPELLEAEKSMPPGDSGVSGLSELSELIGVVVTNDGVGDIGRKGMGEREGETECGGGKEMERNLFDMYKEAVRVSRENDNRYVYGWGMHASDGPMLYPLDQGGGISDHYLELSCMCVLLCMNPSNIH